MEKVPANEQSDLQHSPPHPPVATESTPQQRWRKFNKELPQLQMEAIVKHRDRQPATTRPTKGIDAVDGAGLPSIYGHRTSAATHRAAPLSPERHMLVSHSSRQGPTPDVDTEVEEGSAGPEPDLEGRYFSCLRQRRMKLPKSALPASFYAYESKPLLTKEDLAKDAGFDFNSNTFKVKQFPHESPGSGPGVAIREQTVGLCVALDALQARADASASLTEIDFHAPDGGPSPDLKKLFAAFESPINELAVMEIALNECGRLIHSHCWQFGSLLFRLRDRVGVVADSLTSKIDATWGTLSSNSQRVVDVEKMLSQLTVENDSLKRRCRELEIQLQVHQPKERLLHRLKEEKELQAIRRPPKVEVDAATLERIRDAPTAATGYRYSAQRAEQKWEKKAKHPKEMKDVSVDCSDLFFHLIAEPAQLLGMTGFRGNTSSAAPLSGRDSFVRLNMTSRGMTLSDGGRGLQTRESRPTTALAEHMLDGVTPPVGATPSNDQGKASPSPKGKSKAKKRSQYRFTRPTFTATAIQTDIREFQEMEVQTEGQFAPVPTESVATETVASKRHMSLTLSSTFSGMTSDELRRASMMSSSSPSSNSKGGPGSPTTGASGGAKVVDSSIDRAPLLMVDALPTQVLRSFVSHTATVRPPAWINATILELMCLAHHPMTPMRHIVADTEGKPMSPVKRRRSTTFGAFENTFSDLNRTTGSLVTPQQQTTDVVGDVTFVPETPVGILQNALVPYFTKKYGFNGGSFAADFIGTCQALASNGQCLRVYAFVQLAQLHAATNCPINHSFDSAEAHDLYSAALFHIIDTVANMTMKKRVAKRKLEEGGLVLPTKAIPETVFAAIAAVPPTSLPPVPEGWAKPQIVFEGEDAYHGVPDAVWYCVDAISTAISKSTPVLASLPSKATAPSHHDDSSTATPFLTEHATPLPSPKNASPGAVEASNLSAKSSLSRIERDEDQGTIDVDELLLQIVERASSLLGRTPLLNENVDAVVSE